MSGIAASIAFVGASSPAFVGAGVAVVGVVVVGIVDASLTVSLSSSWTLLPKFVAACGFASAKAPGYEADDFLAAAVAREERLGGTSIVASGDRDSYQLASRRTTIVQPIRAGELTRIGPAQVRERYGVDPAQVPDFIALRGDSSDRIRGAAGVGAVGAASLLERFGTLERMLAAGRFAAQKEKLLLYKSIATMDKSAPLPPLRNQKPTWGKAAKLARRWKLNKLAERLDALAQP